MSFDGRFVTITRKGFMARTSGRKAQKRIPVASIAEVMWKRPGLTNGFIQFVVSGVEREKSLFGTQQGGARVDENAVTINYRQREAMEAVRDAVEVAIAGGGVPDAAGQLQQLASLRDQGIVSAEEFEAKKAEILGRM